MPQDKKSFNRELVISKNNDIKIRLGINNFGFYLKLLNLIKRYQKEKYKDLNPEEIRILYFNDLS